jgi:uncharacterized protein
MGFHKAELLMIIDFHTHAFPGAIRENREKYFEGESAFRLLYDSPKSTLVGASDIIAAMDEQGIDLSVIFGFPWKNPETSRINNDYVMEMVAKYPKRLRGLCCLDPSHGDSVRETERCLSGGLSGVGELAFYESGIDPEALGWLEPHMALCAEKNLPLLLHTNEPVGAIYPGKTPIALNQIYRLVKRFSENKIVLAHWGGGIFFFNLLKREVKESLKNVYFDTAASPFLYDLRIWSAAIELAGVDKILLGTDFPLLKPERYLAELEKAGVSAEHIAKICGNNAATVLDLSFSKRSQGTASALFPGI